MKYTKPTCFSYCSLFTCTRTQPPTHQLGHIHRSTLRRQNNLFITLDFNFYPRTAVLVSRRRIISTAEGDTAVYTKINILIIFHTTGDGPINPPSTLPSTSISIYESLKHGTDMHEISPKRRNTQQRNISTLTTSISNDSQCVPFNILYTIVFFIELFMHVFQGKNIHNNENFDFWWCSFDSHIYWRGWISKTSSHLQRIHWLPSSCSKQSSDCREVEVEVKETQWWTVTEASSPLFIFWKELRKKWRQRNTLFAVLSTFFLWTFIFTLIHLAAKFIICILRYMYLEAKLINLIQ